MIACRSDFDPHLIYPSKSNILPSNQLFDIHANRRTGFRARAGQWWVAYCRKVDFPFQDFDRSRFLSTTKQILRWKDGRKFGRRVQIISASGNYLYARHAEEAYRFCQEGCGEPVSRDINPRLIMQVMVRLSPGAFKPPHIPSARDFGTQPMVVRSKVGNPAAWAGHFTYTLVPLSDSDRWAYLLSQTENIVSV